MMSFHFVFFFFSSRRRHTRLQGDWSSDVCSSDLDLCRLIKEWVVVAEPADGAIVGCGALKIYSGELAEVAGLAVRRDRQGRSEERRVGKEGRSRWAPYH